MRSAGGWMAPAGIRAASPFPFLDHDPRNPSHPACQCLWAARSHEISDCVYCPRFQALLLELWLGGQSRSESGITSLAGFETGPESGDVSLAGFAGGRRPHAPGGRTPMPAAFR